ncbi:MAG: YceD family protein [Brevundimonas sp.]
MKRTLEPDAAARARIAKALDLASLESFTAEMNLAPVDAGWRLSGRVRASLAQICGITLEPLPVEVDAPFSLTLAEAVDEDSDEIVITMEDESPDLIEDGQIDLGQYAVEQLALRLDPFPRKPGAEFVQPPEPAEISPFAVLKQLRPSDEG